MALSTLFVRNLTIIIGIGYTTSLPDAVKQMNLELSEWFREHRPSHPEDAEAFMEQVLLATSRVEWFQTWGAHFLRSLRFAHSRFECHSFIDPSVQLYIDLYPAEWLAVRDATDDAFMRLDAPAPCMIPSTRRCGASGPPPAYHQTIQAVASTGCLHPLTSVTMQDGSKKNCCDLVKGDRVQVPDTPDGDTVACVVSMRRSPDTKMYRVGASGPIVTAWHPVHLDGRWCFPAECAESLEVPGSDYVFSFVLERRGLSLICNGVPAIALAHGREGPIVGHSLWGTDRIVQALRTLDFDGWVSGSIVLKNPHVLRDANGYALDLVRA